MDNLEIQKKIDELKEFKGKNKQLFTTWKGLIEDTNQLLLKAFCIKNLNECDPWYCTFKFTDSCKYSEKLQELENTIKL